MGRRTILQAIQQEAEFFIRFFIRDPQCFKHRTLHGRVVDTDGPPPQLGAVEDHVVGTGQGAFRIALQLFRAAAGHGERMMQGMELAVFLFKHGEVHHPQRGPLAFHQIQVVTYLDPQGAQRLIHDLRLVCPEEDQVARLGAGALENALNGLIGEELEDRGLQAFRASGKIIDLDVGEPLGAVDADVLGVAVDILAGQAATARDFHGCHTPFGVVGRTGEHFEIHTGQQIGNVDQLQRNTQVWLVGAKAAHGFRERHAREVRQLDLQQLLEQAAHHGFGDPHDVLFFNKRGFQVDLGEFRLTVSTQVFIPETLGNLVVTIETGHHQQLLEQLGGLRQRKEAAGMGPAGHQIITGPFRGRTGQDRGFHIHEALAFQESADRVSQARAELEVTQLLGTTQVHVAILEPHFLTGTTMLIQLERRGGRFVKDRQGLAQHLDIPGGHLAVTHGFITHAHPASHFHHVFAAYLVGQCEGVHGVRVEHHLHQAITVTQVEEDHPAMVTTAVYPTAQLNSFSVVGRS